MTVPTGASASIRLPPALEGLRRLAYNLWWSWHPRAKILFSRIDNAAWARYRNPVPVLAGPVAWGELLDSPAFMADYHDDPARVRPVHGERRGPLVPAAVRREARRPARLLLRRVRLPRVAGHLLGRPRRPRRRPHEGRLRHGHPAHRRRPAVPEGLLPPDDRRRRPPGARLPRLRPVAPAAAAASPTATAIRCRSRSSCPGATSRSPSGSRRSAGCRSCCSTRTSPRTTRPTGRSPTSCTSAAGRCASTRSSSWASAGCGRCGRSGIAPAVWHLNEGHSAFLLAERARELRRRRRDARRGLDQVRATACSRSTRPSPAGNERFEADLVRRVAGPLFDGDGRPRPAACPSSASSSSGRGVDATRTSST